MDTAAIIQVIAQVIKTAVDLTPTVIQGVEDAKPFAEAIYNTLKGGNVTDDQLKQLEADISDLSAQLQAPLDPITDDDE